MPYFWGPVLHDEGPAMLGSARVPSLRAYEQVIGHPLLAIEESNVLGRAIYVGRLAAQRLADPGVTVKVDEYFGLEKQVDTGMDARRVMASHHLRLVVGLARRFSRIPEGRAEMIGVGNLALM